MPRLKRDSQRERLYKAERSVRKDLGSGGEIKFQSLVEARAYIGIVVKSDKWTALFGKANYVPSVVLGREGGRATAWLDTRIVLPRWAWCETVVLHELAHIAEFAHTRIMEKEAEKHGLPKSTVHEAWHGRLFAWRFLKLLDTFHSNKKVGKMMRQAFKANRVKYSLPKLSRIGVVTEAAKNLIPKQRKLQAAASTNPNPHTMKNLKETYGEYGFYFEWGYMRSVRVWFNGYFVCEAILKHASLGLQDFVKDHEKALVNLPLFRTGKIDWNEADYMVHDILSDSYEELRWRVSEHVEEARKRCNYR